MPAGIQYYSTTPASNNATPPYGNPEGQAPSTVNDSARQLYADLATFYDDPQWLLQADVPTYISATVFTVPGNRVAKFSVNRRIKATGTTPFTLLGTITTSVFTTLTTVTVSWDAGSLDATLNAVYVYALTGANIASTNVSGLGTMATQNASAVAITGGTVAVTGTTGTALNVTTSGSSIGAVITDTGAFGANIKLAGNGATTPNKYMRVVSGVWQITNSAYTAILAAINDAGDLSSIRSITVNSAGGATNAGDVNIPTGSSYKVNGVALSSGKLVNRVRTNITGTTSGGTAIPYDSTVPQITEGFLFATAAAYTPASTSNVVVVKAFIWLDNATQQYILGALFQDSTANAVASGMMVTSGSAAAPMTIEYQYTPGSLSATTFTFRAGCADASTTYRNQDSGGNTLGGLVSYIEVSEYLP